MERLPQIHLAEDGATSNLVGEVSEMGKREEIKLSLDVQGSEVTYRPKSTTGLRDKVDGTDPTVGLGWIHLLNNAKLD